MARYSKEQRRRAAELYERYEHSAADVIRELGVSQQGGVAHVASRLAGGTAHGGSPPVVASIIRGTRMVRGARRWSIT